MLFGSEVNSKFVPFDKSNNESLSKTHPAAANESYSRLASSSLNERLEEHQLDKKSPWGSENIAVRTLVWSKTQKT